MIYLPLDGDTKKPSQRGWNQPTYQGVKYAVGVGLRTDGILVVDADTPEAVAAWEGEFGVGHTLTQDTRKGRHYFYKATDEWARPQPILKGVLDVKTGPGAFVKVYDETLEARLQLALEEGSLADAPVKRMRQLRPIEPESHDAGWDVIAHGGRNTTLTAIAGAMRKQGAGADAIGNTLMFINRHYVEQGDDPIEEDEIRTIVGSVMRYEVDPFEADGEIVIVDEDGNEVDPWPKLSMSHMTLPPPPRWLWRPYLPFGRLVMLDGEEGIGKGLFCSYVATQYTSGAWGDPAPVLWMSSEDDPREDIQRRLLAAGYQRGVNAEIDFIDTTHVSPAFPTMAAELVRQIEKNGYGLVILDPGRSFLAPEKGQEAAFSYNNEASIRRGLEVLNLIANKLGATVLFVHHWNKDTGANTRNRSGGSKGFRQVVRFVLSMAFHGDTEWGSGALAVTKANIASTGHLMSYSIDEVDEFASAKLTLGMPLPDNDLDSWIKRVEESDGDLELELDLETVLAFYSHREGGLLGPIPTKRELVRDLSPFGATSAIAERLHTELLDSPFVIADGKRTLWLPHGNQIALEAPREV